MMMVLRVNLSSLVQSGERGMAVLLVLIALLQQPAGLGAFVLVLILITLVVLDSALAAAAGFQVHLPADLPGDEPLHVGNISQGSRQVTMLRIARAHVFDCAREKL